MDLPSALIAAVLVGFALAFGLVHLGRRTARQRRDAAALEEAIAKERDVPRTLYPEIDPEICIGSLACLKACPEGVLGIVGGVGRLVQADHCIGHGSCAAECPVGAIKLKLGTATRGVELPEVDEWFESSRPGVHVVGELGGMGLIKNALAQGKAAARRLGETVPRGRGGGGADVVVVGAGPAGLATAFGLQAAGLRYRIFDQASVGGTIATYPRHKIVMTETVHVPLAGKIGKRTISKEELVESLQAAITKHGVTVEEGVRVDGIEGEDGAFVVQTSAGPVRARKVVLATGRRGTPRKLDVPGEESTKVTYALVDPDQYARKKVLVVGAGDAALEAAAQLVREAHAEVTLSYRGEAFGKAREANRKAVEDLAARKKLRILFSSQVKQISPHEVELVLKEKRVRLPNDYVIVLIGGELPTAFLAKVGVGMTKLHGKTVVRPLPEQDEGRSFLRRHAAAALYALLGAAVVAFLTVKGWHYYVLGPAARHASPLHEALRPAGRWGHGVGLVATAFMLANFLYAVRKRWDPIRSLGSLRGWLRFHVFVGFMSPVVIAFHAAFQSRNLLATGTAVALAVVVLTGILGRFIYGMVPSVEGHVEELDTLAAKFERIRERAQPMLARSSNRVRVERALELATRRVPGGSLLLLALRYPASALRLRVRIRGVRRYLPDPASFARFRDALSRLNRIRFQIGFYNRLRHLLRVWRVFHATLAAFLVLVMAAHVALSLYLGYGLK